ncbi:hypothetical protein SDC9_164888 [bioreactor metagenome]|uniref:Thioredoxin domain-containing protein n=1 Tax=bioreactor metagenome TaxID=1076179 RepID=A0A645G093_9ZZZZ
MERLKVGDKMPDLTFKTARGETKTIAEAIGGKPSFFLILRYIGCTVCRYDIHMLAIRYEEFEKKGAQVFIVQQSSAQTIREELNGSLPPYDIICDPDFAIYKALKVTPAKNREELIPPDVQPALKAEVAKANAAGFFHGRYEGIEEQLPAVFLTDAEGIVQYACYSKNIMDKPDFDEMLAML